jgi:hypothetical protein
VSPEMATPQPKRLPAVPSLGRSFCCWVQVPPVRTKTYAEPESRPLSSSSGAPMTAVSPETAIDLPKWSPAAPSAASSLLRCPQISGSTASGYAAPASSTRIDKLPASSLSRAGSARPVASTTKRSEYPSTALPDGSRSSTAFPPSFNTARRPPPRASSITTSAPSAARHGGATDSVKPCSSPSGPLTYHSTIPSRRYSTRGPRTSGIARATSRSSPAHPQRNGVIESSQPPFSPLGASCTPTSVNAAVNPWAGFSATTLPAPDSA